MEVVRIFTASVVPRGTKRLFFTGSAVSAETNLDARHLWRHPDGVLIDSVKELRLKPKPFLPPQTPPAQVRFSARETPWGWRERSLPGAPAQRFRERQSGRPRGKTMSDGGRPGNMPFRSR